MKVETYIQTVEAVQVPPKCSICKDIREITDNIAERDASLVHGSIIIEETNF